MSKKVGLLGYPIAHSLSPVIHNTAYAEMGLDWRYELYPCVDQIAYDAVITAVRTQPAQFIGFNVTTPLKHQALLTADVSSPEARASGGANTLSIGQTTGGCQITAASTDGRGWLADLERQDQLALNAAKVVLYGSGPAALSVLYELVLQPVQEIWLLSRSPSQAQVKADRLATLAVEAEPERPEQHPDRPIRPTIKAIAVQQAATVLAESTLLIDATPLSRLSNAPSIDTRLLHPGLAVYDLNYIPGGSALVRAARATGARAYDGLGMLVEQAALSIELWAAAAGRQLQAPRQLLHQLAMTAMTKNG